MQRRVLAALLALALLPAAARCDPISWSPSSGARAKPRPAYLGYDGRMWGSDFGVLRGRCDTAAVDAALGASDAREVAMVVGAPFLHAMDRRDRACVGQALELGGKRHSITWKNDASGIRFRLTPTRNFERNGTPCREFVTRFALRGRVHQLRAAACRRGDGEWAFLG